jgi:signal transduction histidine kinase
MDHDRQLALLQQMSHALLAPQPLPQRLTHALSQLRELLHFCAARVIVLAGGDPWSLSVPSDSATSSAWPRRLTTDLIRRRESLQQPLPSGRHYLGWPVVWQGTLYAALELTLESPPSDEESALLGAITPLIAIACSQPAPAEIVATPESPPADQQQLDAIVRQLQAPHLLQPLLASLLRLSIERSEAERGAIHLAEANGHGLHLLAFELPEPEPARGTALVKRPRTHDLAKVALANGRAMIRQADSGTQFAAPLIHEGQLLGAIAIEGAALDPQALMFVQRLADVAAPAVLRAQFYQQLADARTHLQQVFDELPTGLALTDSDGTLLRANPAWWRLWGLTAATQEQVRLVPWDMLPQLLPRLIDPLAFSDTFTRAITAPAETVVALQSPWQELQLVLIPVRDALGMAAGFLLAVNDVTREREVDRLKSEFVSVVSHELRTPLTSILGYTELLLARDFEASERKEFIQTVHKEAEHLSNLVEDLLNVSRLDAGKVKLERWVISLPKLVRELVAQLNAELDVERHRLLLDVPETLPPIYADRDRVRQILSNLLSNAIKYSPEGGEVVLHASALRRPPVSAPPLPPEPALLISVRDQGIGIPPQEIDRIFQRFYRVDNSNTRRIGGTGLGLAITKALIELHGGRIWAESTPGEGSTFLFTLPIATEMLRTRRS